MTQTFLDTLLDARIDEIIDGVAAGRPLLLRPRRLDTVERFRHRAATSSAGYATVDLDVSSGSPQASVLDAARGHVPGASGLSEVCNEPLLAYELFIADLRGRDPAPWLTLAGTWASLRSGEHDGPGLAILVDGAKAPRGCDYVDDGGFVGPSEAAIFTAARRQSANLIADCADAAAIEVSRGNLSQLEEMLALPDRDRFDPTAWVKTQPVVEERLIWRGEEADCPSWLAAHAPAQLRQRVWRGQVSILFPWLAIALRKFLDKNEPRLPSRIPAYNSEDMIERDDFEWGDIIYILGSRGAHLEVACADRMRRIRNALAHQRPLSWQEASRAEADVRTLMKW